MTAKMRRRGGSLIVLRKSFFVGLTVVVALIADGTWAVLTYGVRDRENLRRLTSRSFVGASRHDAYARLARLGMTPQAWTLRGDDEELEPVAWPAAGDAAVLFSDLPRGGPPGTCGAQTVAVIRFARGHVRAVEERAAAVSCL